MKILSICLMVFSLSAPVMDGAGVREDSAKEETTELGEQMDRMGTAFRKLRKQAGDAAMNASSLELLGEMQKVTQDALDFVPAKAQDLPEADRAAFTEGFRAQMRKFIAVLEQTVAAFKAGDNGAAVKLVGELGDLSKASHKEYKRPDRD